MIETVKILGIETSCDETSAAVVIGGVLAANVVAAQVDHTQYGGVVPELASRAHQKLIVPVIDEALAEAQISPGQLTAVAGVRGPGLMGALLVGLNFAKSFAYGLGIPFYSVNHMEAHIYSNFIEDPVPEFPFLCLTVSGGHTQLVLVRNDFEYEIVGDTRDDAAGEAFDKVAKILGLGYPGGPKIDQLAKQGNPQAIRFPRTYLEGDPFGFSFSGIKTAVLYYLRDNGFITPDGVRHDIPAALLADLCASFQAAVIEVLVEKTIYASKYFDVMTVAVAGGVSANSGLRSAMTEASHSAGKKIVMPKIKYCTDNGAMIAAAGYRKYFSGKPSSLDVTAIASLDLPRWTGARS